MPEEHSKTTIISMAVIASLIATLLHEGVGHGVTAWLRGDIVTELTSNHLASVRPDKWVDAGGTLVNLLVGTLSLLTSPSGGASAARRYFFWLLAAFNLLPAAGYFLFSGVFGFGDWHEVISDLAHPIAWRIGMSLFGAVLYLIVVRLLAISLKPFVKARSDYNTVGRLPYYAACTFSCVAGAFDPLGIKLLFVSTIPAAFGGSSGLLWADALIPREDSKYNLAVPRLPAWWIAAVVIGIAYIAIIGPGVQFSH